MVHESISTGRDRPHPRARRRAETVSELLDHAERVVLAEGLEALSMHRLAAEHGVRVAALYRYWPSKDGLLSALLERTIARVRENLSHIEAFEQATIDGTWSEQERALLRLIRVAGVYLELSRERPELISLVAHFLAPAKNMVDPTPELLADTMAVVNQVAELFAGAAEVGALSAGDAIQRTALYWTSLQGWVAASKLTRFGVGGDRASLERALVQTLLVGFGADAGLLSRSLERALSAP